MKKIFSIILMYGFINITNAADTINFDELKLYNSLLKKQSQKVHFYSGYLFNVVLVDEKPRIMVNYVSARNDKDGDADEKPKSIQVMFANSHPTQGARQVYDREWEVVKGLTPQKFVVDKIFKREGLIKFNAYDSGNNLLFSDFRNEDNAFSVEQIYYSISGKILSMQFYNFLRINKKGRSPKVDDFKIVNIEKFISKAKAFNGNDPESIKSFSKEVFREVVSKEKDEED